MAEWSNAAVSKTVIRGNLDREFKSLPLRHSVFKLCLKIKLLYYLSFLSA